jgi:hypothetical protein
MVSTEQIEQAAQRIGGAAGARAVYLFGSYARKQARSDSDVDFFVIADDPRPGTNEADPCIDYFGRIDSAWIFWSIHPTGIGPGRIPCLWFPCVLEEGKLVYGKGA